MKTTSILSLGLAAIGVVLAAPTVQYEEAPSSSELLAGSGDKWVLHVNSVSGNPPMFKDRSIVALGEGTIDGLPQNHAPPQQVHLPPSFGLENFTVHPPSTPVIVTLAHIDEQNGTRYSLTSKVLTNVNWRNVNFTSQYALRSPKFIAMGWSTVLGDHDCPKGLRCDPLNWDICGERGLNLLRPADQEGAWDAVKTKEGLGWRVVWKPDMATVHSEVQISVVPFDKKGGLEA
ncbi:hypothetical protein P171DRAFT_445669 [Karstenula rhodostoma CBS 690.94]|uniref:Uncharacterized protein n=1 Tax=Karstenula rhodostoma CBS 690.94 TaxID=1392251 RepID=A0A9P4PFW6_9PLEO|nr:hypothetical protein P171DRAFT_445669 [Karstenula rhodostoma CBS 690.94]